MHQLIDVERPEVNRGHGAAGVDQDARRNREGDVAPEQLGEQQLELVNRLGGRSPRHEREVHILEQLAQDRGLGRSLVPQAVHAQRQHGQAEPFQIRLPSRELGQLGPAWRAPAGPQVHE